MEGGTRERLLEAAFQVFTEKGYTGARVQEIAERAGLTTGAIYANFDGKAALLGRAIAYHGFAAFRETVAEMVDESPAAVFQTLAVEALAGPSLPVHRLVVEALAAALRDQEVTDLVRPQIERMHEQLTAAVERGRAAGGVADEFDTEALVALGSVVVLGSYVLKALDVPRPDRDAAEAVQRRVLGAFAPRPRRQPPAGEG